MKTSVTRPVRPATIAALLAGTVLGGGLLTAAPARAATASPAGVAPVTGYDISWPNCPVGLGIPQRPTQGEPMPPAHTSMVVIGLTNGPGFTPNPCLARQVAWARAHHTWTGGYAVASFPTPAELARYGRRGPWRATSRLARIRNAGYAQARANLGYARRAHLPVRHVWVDVEPVRGWTWSTPAENRALLAAVVRGYTSAGVRVGFYSYRSAWEGITGGWRVGSPVWSTGATTPSGALARCARPSFSGGPVVLSQWYTPHGNVDYDVTCPKAARMSRYFARF